MRKTHIATTTSTSAASSYENFYLCRKWAWATSSSDRAQALSGGENQRVKLAYFIGKEEQEPTLFIFDEPTTGLHFHDIRRLLHAFNALIERGHSLVVIEHNLDVIKCADYIIDLGPDGGDKGGNLVACGTPQQVAACPGSITGQFLKKYLPK